jgi:hypothetical protein
MNNVPAMRKEAMENKDNDNKEDDGANIFLDKEAALRKQVMEKNCKQETSAIKAMKICGRAALENGVGIGALASLKVDYHIHCHAQGLLAIVYRFHVNTGGILVCCEHGVVTHDGSSNSYWPYNKYRVVVTKDSTFPISKKLQAVRDKVLPGNFLDDNSTPRISFSKYVNIDLGTANPIKCSCKRRCNKGCGCKKKGVRCHSGCACNGNCH